MKFLFFGGKKILDDIFIEAFEIPFLRRSAAKKEPGIIARFYWHYFILVDHMTLLWLQLRRDYEKKNCKRKRMIWDKVVEISRGVSFAAMLLLTMKYGAVNMEKSILQTFILKQFVCKIIFSPSKLIVLFIVIVSSRERNEFCIQQSICQVLNLNSFLYSMPVDRNIIFMIYEKMIIVTLVLRFGLVKVYIFNQRFKSYDPNWSQNWGVWQF